MTKRVIATVRANVLGAYKDLRQATLSITGKQCPQNRVRSLTVPSGQMLQQEKHNKINSF